MLRCLREVHAQMWQFLVLLRAARRQPALMAFLARECVQVLLPLLVLCHDVSILDLRSSMLSCIVSFSELRCVGTAFERGDGRGLFGCTALGGYVHECGLFGCCGLHVYYLQRWRY